MYKESIIKISTPMSKVQTQPDESELEQETTQTQEIAISEELQQPPEPIDVAPASIRFASTHSNGWKASDILREIRLDSFEMSGLD